MNFEFLEHYSLQSTVLYDCLMKIIDLLIAGLGILMIDDSFLSKLRVVKLRLVDYLSTNNLLNYFQSAYIKHHSTETTLLSVHDHIIKAMSHQQVTCLTLLDISAAFDTIDHSILRERL